MDKEKLERMHLGQFYKKNPGDQIWCIDALGEKEPLLFSFDRETIFNYWPDYPEKLTKEEKAIFDKENPFWAEFRSGKK